MIIGIGGVSRAGKSNLTAWLVERFESQGKNTRVFHQDEYVFPEAEIPHIKERVDWEHPASIDFVRFDRALQQASSQVEVVIAEGLMAFFDAKINESYHKRLFIEIDYNTFLRRKARDSRWGYEPPWYIEHIWTSYLKFGLLPETGAKALILNGKLPWENQAVFDYLNKPEDNWK